MDYLTIPREVVDKREAGMILGIENSDFDTYLSEQHAKDFAAGRTKIPQMPHIPGRPVKFYLVRLREWHQRFFERGWKPEDAEPNKKKKNRARIVEH
jgi:hypothetical protein